MYLCRIYTNGQKLFSEPCDSRLIGVIAFRRAVQDMKLLGDNQLKKRAIRIEEGNGNVIFMAILHEY